jgi:hypothetical protein
MGIFTLYMINDKVGVKREEEAIKEIFMLTVKLGGPFQEHGVQITRHLTLAWNWVESDQRHERIKEVGSESYPQPKMFDEIDQLRDR